MMQLFIFLENLDSISISCKFDFEIAVHCPQETSGNYHVKANQFSQI